MENLGTRIRKQRKRMGLTQAELADKVGISVMSIRRYEKMEREPSFDTVQKISHALQTDMADLWPEAWPEIKSELFLDFQADTAFCNYIKSCGYELYSLCGDDGHEDNAVVINREEQKAWYITDEKYHMLRDRLESFAEFQIADVLKNAPRADTDPHFWNSPPERKKND